MRPFTLPALLLLAALLPAASSAEEKTTLELKVGEVKPLTGFRPICDDPSVVVITAQGEGTIKGLKVGETVCSWSVGSPLGVRMVVRVVVVEPPKGRDKGGAKG